MTAPAELTGDHVAHVEAARLCALLWQKPVMSDGDVPQAIGIPPSLWAALKSAGDTPPLFTLGRRLFVKTDDLREWLDLKAACGRPGSRRRREAAE